MVAKLSRRAGLALAIAAAARPAGAEPARVRVASKLDTEGALLGTMMLLMLAANGIPTASHLRLGDTGALRAAILAGEIDLYPEYTGNGAFFFRIATDPVWKNARDGYVRVRQLDAETNNLAWLTPAPANDSWGIAVRRDVASANRLATMEDFARWVRGGGRMKLVASAEFMESPAALPAFEAAYDFRITSAQAMVLAGGDTGVTIRAAAEGTSGANAAMVYGTDGAIAALGLVMMEDIRGAQMVFAPTPVIRAPVLAAWPAIQNILAPAFASLDDATLRALNAQVAVDGRDIRQVAADYLRGKGLLT